MSFKSLDDEPGVPADTIDSGTIDRTVKERDRALSLLNDALLVIEGRVGMNTATGKAITKFLDYIDGEQAAGRSMMRRL